MESSMTTLRSTSGMRKQLFKIERRNPLYDPSRPDKGPEFFCRALRLEGYDTAVEVVEMIERRTGIRWEPTPL